MLNLDAKRARRILIAQVVVTLTVSLIALGYGRNAALFALLGGAIATTANAMFAYFVFRRYTAAKPEKMVGQALGGELIKLGFIIVAFAAVMLAFESVEPLALIGAFFVVQVLPPLLANWVAR